MVKHLEATSDGHGSARRFERLYSEVAALEVLQVCGRRVPSRPPPPPGCASLPWTAAEHGADAHWRARVPLRPSHRPSHRPQGQPGVCRLLGHGLVRGRRGAATAYQLVLQRYRCTLAEWRAGPDGHAASLGQLLGIYARVADAVVAMHAAGVAHFDLKCSNVLLDGDGAAAAAGGGGEGREEAGEGVVRGAVGGGGGGGQPLPVLADFGQAVLLDGRCVPVRLRLCLCAGVQLPCRRSADDSLALLSRARPPPSPSSPHPSSSSLPSSSSTLHVTGTELFSAPEVLLLSVGVNRRDHVAYDR